MQCITHCYTYILTEVAEKVFDKCITVNKPYEVTYNFEFLDDLYQILGWARESKQRKKGKSSGMVH